MLIHEKGQLQLGAHAVGAADQHRLLHAGDVQLKQAAEAPHVGADPRGHGAGNVALHKFNCPVAGGDVHPGGSVRIGMTVAHVASP